jgi:hypothetical protein
MFILEFGAAVLHALELWLSSPGMMTAQIVVETLFTQYGGLCLILAGGFVLVARIRASQHRHQ